MQEYPQIIESVYDVNKQAYGSNQYLLDKDFILFTLYYYQENPFESPKTETEQDIVWAAERILPRNEWGISQASHSTAESSLKVKKLLR